MTVIQIIEMASEIMTVILITRMVIEMTAIRITEMDRMALEAMITEMVSKDVMTDAILRQRMILYLRLSLIQERLIIEKIIRKMTDVRTMNQRKTLSL